MRSLLTPLLVFAACSAPLQADITVGPAGSGAQTSNINDAIFNAEEGETIFVLAGHYQNISINNKSVRIIGAGSDQVKFSYSGDGTFSQSSRILGLSEDREVFISGVTFDAIEGMALNGALWISGNRGRVAFHECTFRSTSSAPNATITVVDSEEVRFDQCRLLGFEPEVKKDPLVSTGGQALDAEGSTLSLNGCLVRGGDTQQPAPFVSSGGIGMRLDDCSVLLHNTEVRGGKAYEQPLSPSVGSGSGISATQSEVTISGIPDTLIAGGDGMSTTPTSVALGSPAISLVDSSLIYSEGVVLVGGMGSDGSQADPVENGTSPVTVELFQRPGLRPSTPSAAPGESFDLLIDGEPLSAHAVALALGTVPTYTLAAVFGDVILDPASTTVLAAVSLDANGVGTLGIDVPVEPALSGTVGWFQSLQTGLGGGARVSLPSALVVGQ